MTNSDKKEFTETIQVLAAAFNKDASKAFLQAYWLGLSDLAIGAIKSAANNALHNSRFMPTPAELRDMAGVVRLDDQAVLAFGLLEATMRKHGSYASIDFDDKAINAAINALGGWEAACEISDEEFFGFFRKRFLETYKAIARRGSVSAEAGKHLIGYHERNNSFYGFHQHIKPAVKIGCEYPAIEMRRPPDEPPLRLKKAE